MPKIKETKPGRLDGAYSRLIGNSDIGALLSQVHATTIRAGSELGTLLLAATPLRTSAEELLALLSDTPPTDRTYVVSEAQVRKYIGPKIKTKHCPDFLLFDAPRLAWTIIELKDGDTFDTKKTKGEIQALTDFQQTLATAFPSSAVNFKICSFNASNPQQVVDGFKNKIPVDQALTGAQFCALIEVDHAKIQQQRERDQAENLLYLEQNLLPLLRGK